MLRTCAKSSSSGSVSTIGHKTYEIGVSMARAISRFSRRAVTAMHVASVTLRVHQSKRVEALSAIDELMRHMRASPGCLTCRLLVELPSFVYWPIALSFMDDSLFFVYTPLVKYFN